ncbi:hypothetical protein LDR49_003833 [Salmonella enterica]|uniref:Uncharacterized protein n=1 Tax=Salmonella enterica TaxID=28901 RepID=A0A5U7LUT6_SALER|nr:hypothetical protein [Salmonella enterica]EBP3305630.1 hypothetical protein [Salmonella enterica subsp. enterica]ELE3222554.1 hypothetical protein [Salmonella enterica subsp. enterica serovar Rubislaw]EAX8478874.1 hypothetical protein [Salmonella enterica]EBR4142589.1 hypothetical protein [Salmonella enterica]
MKRIQRILTAPGFVVLLLIGNAVGAEPVSPRFPDTELAAPSQEEDAMSRQGQVYVSGTLLVSPCVLSDWATEMQGRNWMFGALHQVTLALEGCGDGGEYTGLQQHAPLPVRSLWWDGKAFPLRLKDGMNYLTLPVRSGTGGMRLEMTYE